MLIADPNRFDGVVMIGVDEHVVRHTSSAGLNQRAAEVLSHFDRPATANGQTEALNGRLEPLGGSALGFCNSTATSPSPCSSPADSHPGCTRIVKRPVLSLGQ